MGQTKHHDRNKKERQIQVDVVHCGLLRIVPQDGANPDLGQSPNPLHEHHENPEGTLQVTVSHSSGDHWDELSHAELEDCGPKQDHQKHLGLALLYEPISEKQDDKRPSLKLEIKCN